MRGPEGVRRGDAVEEEEGGDRLAQRRTLRQPSYG